MTKKHNISQKDKELFRQTVNGTKRLKQDKVNMQEQKPSKQFKKRTRNEEPESTEDTFSDFDLYEPVGADEHLFFSRAGIQHKTLQKLKRGQLTIEASLDLHGCTVEKARQQLSQFLYNCQQQSIKVVCIIHGKSQHSQPIIKNKVNSWLRQTEQVNAFCSAQAKHGGTGAVYVFLKTITLI